MVSKAYLIHSVCACVRTCLLVSPCRWDPCQIITFCRHCLTSPTLILSPLFFGLSSWTLLKRFDKDHQGLPRFPDTMNTMDTIQPLSHRASLCILPC